jgi:hypothetical protein
MVRKTRNLTKVNSAEVTGPSQNPLPSAIN